MAGNFSGKPYVDDYISDNVFIRTFDKNINSEELVWHRDYYDRTVFVLKNTTWMLQFDNNIPIKLTEGYSIRIPKLEYHRLIKGYGDLVLKIYEEKS